MLKSRCSTVCLLLSVFAAFFGIDSECYWIVEFQTDDLIIQANALSLILNPPSRKLTFSILNLPTINLPSSVLIVTKINSLGHHKYHVGCPTSLLIGGRNSALIPLIFDLKFIWYSAIAEKEMSVKRCEKY